MPIDPDSLSLKDWISALLGIGGGGAAIAKQIHSQGQNDHRLKTLEITTTAHSAKIDTIETLLSALNERSIGANERGNRIEAKLDRVLEKE